MLLIGNIGLKLACRSALRESRSPASISALKFHASPPGRAANAASTVSTVSADDVRKFLEEKKISSEHGYSCLSFVCPSVPKTKSAAKAADENNRIYVNTHTGAFVCNYCLQSGDYANFQNLLTSISVGKTPPKTCQKLASAEEGQTLSPDRGDVFEGMKRVGQMSSEEFSALKQKLGIADKLEQTTLTSYECYASIPNLDSMSFPYYGPAHSTSQRLRGVRSLDLQKSEATTSKMRQLINRQLYGLFGWQLLSKRTTEVILTASELDAMSVYQSISHSPSSSVAVLALPCGYQTLPQNLLPMLESFRKITLWLGSELQVWQAAKQFARKLGEKRCYLVRPSDQFTGPHDALAKGVDLKDIIANAYPAAHKAIVSFSQLRQDVLAELTQSEQVAGVRWRKYTRLNEILKGHRRGELTIFTGPTGAGKTTFISDYSLDLAMQGVATLWGSFEISNIRLCKLMLTQFAGRKLTPGDHLKQEFSSLGDQFEQMPIHFLTFHGSESLKKVIEAMTHAVYVHDIQHVVIDNLQFMMDVSDDRGMIDRFQKQDQIVAALRRFATQQQCHVTLVIHPRKEQDGMPLTNSSIFGGVKAVQEADNVMILQPPATPSSYGEGGGYQSYRNNQYGQQPPPPVVPSYGPNTKCINITKNRFDGELGKLLLRFNRDALTFEQVGQQKIFDQQQSQNQSQRATSPFQFKQPVQNQMAKPAYMPPPRPAQPKPVVIEHPVEEETGAASSVDALLADLGR